MQHTITVWVAKPLKLIVYVVTIFLSVFSYSALAGLTITDVSASHKVLNVNDDSRKPLVIQFSLNQAASALLAIYDARNRLVKQVDLGQLSAGKHEAVWLGDDSRDRAVPSEVYYYTLTAKSSNQTVIYDVTDLTGGESIAINSINYDELNDEVTYALDRPTRLFIRAGIKNSFMIKTLVDGEVNAPGLYRVPWDGRSEGGDLHVKGQNNYELRAEGFVLSDNAIIVKNDALQHRWIDDLPKAQKRKSNNKRLGLHPYAYQPIEYIKDVPVTLTIVDIAKQQAAAQPTQSMKSFKIGDVIAVRLEVSEQDAMMLEEQRAEVVFYMNNELMTENEVSYFPYTWHLKTDLLPEGDYYITGFVVGYGRQFGSMTKHITLTKP